MVWHSANRDFQSRSRPPAPSTRSSSRITPLPLLSANSLPFSRVWDMLLDIRYVENPNTEAQFNWLILFPHRSCNESTNMVANRLRVTTWLSTTAPHSTMLLERELERRSCTPPLEGRKTRTVACRTLLTRTETSLIGIGEIVLLPLDVLKIKRQTNPESFRGRGLFKIIADEGMGLYRGAGWTAARNAPGSFAVSLSILFPHSFPCFFGNFKLNETNGGLALRWFCFRQGVHLRPEGLQLGLVDSELCRLGLRCQCLVGCFCSLGRDQDPYPEPQL